MVNCTGKSLIPINIGAFQSFMASVVPSGKIPELNIKFDARAKVKSVFAKLEGVDLTLYTGAIVALGAQKFPEIPDALSLLMLFTIYGVKKVGAGEQFEVKSTDQGISEIKTDSVFQELSGKVHFFVERFKPINDQAISIPEPVQVQTVSSQTAPIQQPAVSHPMEQPEPQPVQEEKPKKKASANDSPFKGVPLVDTPKIDVPDDLDLRAV